MNNKLMKIKFTYNPTIKEPLITIEGPEDHPQVKALSQVINQIDGFIIGKKQNRSFRIAILDVFYMEYHEDTSLIFTENDTFQTDFRLYELEQISHQFVRIHKSFVVNISKITSFQSTLNGRLDVTLSNGDRLTISRAYVPNLKKILGEK
jgi:DNA-binding LytR/AlgR family response regulator